MLTAPSNGKRLLLILLVTFIVMAKTGASARTFDGPGTEAGVVITNQAAATYVDDSGTSYGTVSPTVTITVLVVSTLTTTPDEVSPSAQVGPNERITRLFRVCNTGNTGDLYTITRADATTPASLVNLYFDADASGTVTNSDTLIHLDETLSPRVPPGDCTGVLAVVDTRDFPANTNLTIRITAHSNVVNAVNGRSEDDGTIINAVGAGPHLADPADNSLPPSKLVNGNAQAVVSPGQPFAYTIAFRNSGDTPARSVVVADDLPAELNYIDGSLQLDNRNLTDANDGDEGSVQNRRVLIQLAEVTPDQVVRISFRASLSNNATAGVGVVNTANVSAQNVVAASTSAATVVSDPFGTVFAGRGGSAAPIPGAHVEMLLDQSGAALLNTQSGIGFVPNAANDNPFMTDALGHFSFVLASSQQGAANSPAHYFIRITAQGYLTRMLEVTARPARAGLFALLVHSLDGQPLARAGGFDLVREDVSISDLAAVVLNIPMFEQHGLELSKSVDRQRVEIGDVVSYRLEIHNPTAGAATDVVVHDRLPVSFTYVAGTARLVVNTSPEQAIEPELSGDELVFRIGTIGPGINARVTYRVRIGANAREGEQENVAIASGAFPSGEHTQTTPARASVTVGGGVFSTRQIIVGRVFVDANNNGKFDEGDAPVPGVRLYLTSGQSVLTDSEGLYNFPSLSDGPQVISLDPVSLPQRYALADDGSVSGRSWTRMLRTPLGGGALMRQNFILRNTRETQRNAAANSFKPKAKASTSTNARDSAANSNASTNSNVSTSSNSATNSQPVNAAMPPVVAASPNAKDRQALASGTYEFVTTETLEPVSMGEVQVVWPQTNMVVMTPALQLDARVALNWTVKLEVNGHLISNKSIGTTRQDQKNQITTYTFVGIDLKPGPNLVRLTPVGPDGAAGRIKELTLMGRGPARKIEIVSEKKEIQAGGRDSTILHIKAYDQWNSPAVDDQVAIETSAGQLLRLSADGVAENPADKNSAGVNASVSNVAQPALATPANGQSSQLIVQLKDGEAVLKLIGPGAPGAAHLRAQMGTKPETQTEVRITPELRPAILVGLAEMSIGQSIPEVALHNEQGNMRSRLSFFFNGRIFGDNVLTLAYDSQRPINRTAGRDRLFQLDPLDRAYPLFGDSSTRFEAAPSNSKLYARIDHNRSFAMFGDFEADMNELALAGYSRKLTGVKLHLENSSGDFVTVTGARPDTSFARDVFPAGTLGLLRLSHSELLPGSETVVLEVRDRRNPEIIISRETLTRSIDYNLNAATGEIFFLRYISAFDYDLNLVQLVVTYEHRASSLSSAVYTARARKNFAGLGLTLGLSGVMQKQEDAGTFMLSGFDAEKALPHKGKLRFAFARSQGEMMAGGNLFEPGSAAHNGNAYLLELDQPFARYETIIHARFAAASAGFFNPFGATVTPGSRRGEIAVEFKPRASSTLRFGVMDERNRTVNVDNSRFTLSAGWDQIVGERLRFHLGFDHRHFSDALNDRTTDSNLVTAAAEMKVTDRLQLSVKREQNLGEADPTYPTQTTLAATYQVNKWARMFMTQRLSAAAITPIGDFAQGGFSGTRARRETAFGVETRLGKYSSMISRYQLENGISGTDSFAVIGLQNHLPLNKRLQLELGLEHSFHLAGSGQSYDSATVGFSWLPLQDFRANARYEFRSRNGMGQLLALGAAGRLREGVTALTRFQFARTNFQGRNGSTLEGMAALAIRPLKSDRVGLLFNYTHRSLFQDALNNRGATRERLDSLSTDGYFQATRRLELFGRVALRFTADGQNELPFVSTLTYMTQGRVQYRLTRRLDWAGEMRLLVQPSSGTERASYGTELGLWAMPDLRLGLGYNFTQASEPQGRQLLPLRRGFYFTISSKLSSLFDLFGTQNNAPAADQPNDGGQP